MTFDPEYPPQPAPPRTRWERLRQRLPRFGGSGGQPGGPRGEGARWGGWRRAGLAVLAVVVLYYVVGMAWIHTISDDPDFAPVVIQPGESRAVAMMAALIDREVDQNRWTPNDPFFIPSVLLDNMPNYQMGIVSAMSRLAVELTDHLGRTRGTSQADPNLERAAGYLKYPPDVWIWNPSVSLAPTATSEQQYRAARRELLAYNQRLGTGQAVFERRADNLMSTLDRIAADTGSISAAIDRHLEEHGGSLFDFTVDDIFYNNKGRLYAYYLILRELGKDFENVIRERELQSVWNEMLDTFRTAALLQPWVVLNGAPDSQLLPSHLASQGFFILRARFQLYEAINILQK